MESIDHLFIYCRSTLRLREKAKVWLGINELHTKLWVDLSFLDWWNTMSSGQDRKAMATLTMLITWEIWNNRNDK
jgi:hypothetical protein